MGRNYGIMSGRSALGGTSDRPSATRDAMIPRDSNSLAGDPPRRFNLAIVRDGSFLQKHELNPVERLDAELDHREFAACVMFAVLITFTFGAPLAIAVAFMSFG